MHYYQHHIGDFLKDTGNLTNEQVGIYMKMIWRYYMDERPLEDDCESIAFAVRSDEKTVRLLLKHYFCLEADGWRHKRCDQEILAYHKKSEKARESANARWGDANAMRTHTERNAKAPKTDANHKPITNKEEAKASVASGDRLPPCDLQAIVDLYHRILPEMPAVRLMSDPRRKAARTFWAWVLTSKKSDGSLRASNAQEALEWIEAYFDRARDNDFLMGRGERSGKHGNWVCDFDFLLTEKGKKHVIEKTGVAA
jgi:uncharacterized protein YdaU (DUF1376 family)